jgi:hypothetical protein
MQEARQMELTEEMKVAYREAAKALKGHDRRVFMARIVKAMGKGGQRRAERELGWCRETIRKGMGELENGEPIIDNFKARGRKRAEAYLPHLLEDIKAIADAQSQTDPTFQSTRLYTRISAAEMRRQLMAQKGYRDAELPSEETIRVKMNELGYCLRSVQKSRPQKDSANRCDLCSAR